MRSSTVFFETSSISSIFLRKGELSTLHRSPPELSGDLDLFDETGNDHAEGGSPPPHLVGEDARSGGRLLLQHLDHDVEALLSWGAVLVHRASLVHQVREAFFPAPAFSLGVRERFGRAFFFPGPALSLCARETFGRALFSRTDPQPMRARKVRETFFFSYSCTAHFRTRLNYYTLLQGS